MGRPVRQKKGEEAGERVGHGAEGGRQVVGHRPVGQAGVGLHRGQHAVGERVHKGHQDVDESQVGRALGGHLLLQSVLGLAAVLWGTQVLPFLRPDGVEGDLRGEEVFYGGFPALGLTLEEKEGGEAAGHHAGEHEEEDQGREVGGQVTAFQAHRGGCCPSELRPQSAASSLGETKQGPVRSLGNFFFFFFFLQTEGLRQPCVEPRLLVLFPTAFAHFLPLGHILVILE